MHQRFKVIALTVAAVFICYIDRVVISLAIIPMSEEAGWSETQKGIIFLLLISYIFSTNRKAINWKTIGLSLLIQIVIAVGVIKVNWIANLFEFFGSFFLKILDFTNAGTSMVLGEFVNIEKHKERYEFTIFNEPFVNESDASLALEEFDALLIMRERTPITTTLIQSMKNLKYVMIKY